MSYDKIIGLDRRVVGELGLRNVVLPADDGYFDFVLRCYGRVARADDGGVLKAVSFAVVVHDCKVLVVEKGAEQVLGFGRGCRAVSGFSLCRTCVVENLHEELDLYIPGEGYGIRPLGLVYSDHRDYDAGSIGFLYRVELERAIGRGVVAGGGSGICLRGVDELDGGRLYGWSRIIFDLLNFRLRIGIRDRDI